MTTWYANMSWVGATPTDPDLVFDLLDALTDHSPSGSISRDGLSGCVSLAVEAETFDSAVTAVLGSTRDALARHIPGACITGMELRDEDAMDAELAQPTFPEAVGYAEIAEMAEWVAHRNTRSGRPQEPTNT